MARITVHIPDELAEAARRLAGTDDKTSVSAMAAKGLTNEIIRAEALKLRQGGWPPAAESLELAVTRDQDREAAR